MLKITLTAQWKDKTTEPEVTNYPVYVYGYFTHGDNTEHLTGNITVNGKKIEWNEDENLSYPEYYITFGKIPEGTTETPIAENATTANFNTAKLAELKGDNLFNGTGNATTNGVTWTAVGDNWEALKTRPGAASYNGTGGVDENALTWHLDGAIKVYTVAYDDGVDGTSVAICPLTPKATSSAIIQSKVRNPRAMVTTSSVGNWKVMILTSFTKQQQRTKHLL